MKLTESEGFRIVNPRATVEIHLPDERVLEGPRGKPIETFLRVLPEWLKISKGHNVSMYHNQGKSSSNLLNLVWRREIKRLSKGSTILFGSSCMVVATPDARNT